MSKKAIIKIVIFLVVLLIPIIYSFFYLKSYWDPYGNLTDIKIAIVNLDRGSLEENQGKEFLEELKKDGTFNICDVTLDEANKGLQEGEYYAMIMIPENFTESLNSAKEENKQIATITYTPNKATNYLATQIVNSAIKSIEIDLRSKVSSKVVDSLSDKLKEVPESLEDVSEGTEKLINGTEKLSKGLNDIKNGIDTLNNNYTDFDNGISSAYEGSKSLGNGISQVNSGIGTLNSGANKLDQGISQINNGANTLSSQAGSGINKLTEGMKKVDDGASQISAGTAAIVQGTSESSELGAGMTAVSNGASAIAQATSADSKLGTGASQVAAGASALAQGTGAGSELAVGAANLSGGLSSYVDTVNSLLPALVMAGVIDDNTLNTLNASGAGLVAGANGINAGIGTLNANAQALAVGANAVNAGIGELNKNANNLATGAGAVNNGIKVLNSKAQELNNGAQALKTGAAELAGTETIKSLNTLVNGIGTLKSALNEVSNGTGSLKNGITTLSSGTNKLQEGSNTLTNGLGTLNSSSKQIKNGLNSLDSGSVSAYKGSLDLLSGLRTLKNGVDDGIKESNKEIKKLDGLGDFVEKPIEFKEESYGEVKSYGIAFTPLFLCIGLWVGALMCYVVLYYDQKNRFGIFGSDYNNKLLQNAIYILIGAVEGLVTSLLLKIGLGFNVQNLALYYFSSILIGITFMSIIQFLIRNFGDVGKFLALIILVLELAASGGTFPVETIDKGFRGMSNFLPMTYTIKLLKEVLVPTITNYKEKYFLILISISVICILLTNLVDIVKKKKDEVVSEKEASKV